MYVFDKVCRTNRSPGFAWINCVLPHVVETLDRLPSAWAVDTVHAVRLICTFHAEEVSKLILAATSLDAKTAIEKIPKDGELSIRLIRQPQIHERCSSTA
jgi:hypothetical protein